MRKNKSGAVRKGCGQTGRVGKRGTQRGRGKSRGEKKVGQVT